MRFPLTSLLLLTLVGCATQVIDQPPTGQQLSGGKVLAFQQKSLAPRSGGQLVGVADLRHGDILLSAEGAPTSAAIRFITLAPVSHAALYVGAGEVAEALRGGVRLRSLDAMIAQESVIAVFRHPQLDDAAGQRISAAARAHVGQHYDFIGTFLYVPFSLQRLACELPALPTILRGACISTLATVQLGLPGSTDRFFCSSFVLDAYRDAGVPITRARPTWLSPGDILHMREGDVSALPVEQPLLYVGHLKFTPWALDLPALQIPLTVAPPPMQPPPLPGQ